MKRLHKVKTLNNRYYLFWRNIILFILFREQFLDIGRWVADMKIDPHLVDVVYELVDDHGHGKLSINEFSTILFSWRHTRGFRHSRIQLSVGHYEI